MPRTPTRRSADASRRVRSERPRSGRRRRRSEPASAGRRSRGSEPDPGLRTARMLVAILGAAALGVVGAGAAAVLWGAGLLGERELPGRALGDGAAAGAGPVGVATSASGGEGAAAAHLDGPEAALLDPALPLARRRAAALRLAERRTPESLALLERALLGAPALLRAELAPAMGATGRPEALVPLEALLHDGDPAVALAAVRGLTLLGGSSAETVLVGLARDATRAPALRVEAARALGAFDGAAARATLAELAQDGHAPPALVAAALESSARREDVDVARVFGPLLDPESSPVSRRRAAAEALAAAGPRAAPFLLAQLVRDPDAEVRAAAARAISHLPPGVASPDLLQGRLEAESDPHTRGWLYLTLGADPHAPVDALFDAWSRERDPEARLHAARALATALGKRPDASAYARFDAQVLDTIVAIARDTESPAAGLARHALRLAGTPGAEAALVGLDAPRAAPARPDAGAGALGHD